MDRIWMSKVRTSAEYKQGVEQFLSFAFRDVADGKIFCPCVNCANKRTQTYDEVKTHLRCDGILQGYTTWIHHGEQFDSSAAAVDQMSHATDNVPISPIPRQRDYSRLDDMLGLLNAVSNIPGGSVSHFSVSEGPLDEQMEYTDVSDSSSEEDNVTTLDDENVFPGEENDAAEGEDEINKKDKFSSFWKDADCSLYEGIQSFPS